MDFNIICFMLITIILIFIGFIKKNSNIIFIIQIIWMYLLLAGNTQSMDYGVYTNMFETSQNKESAIGNIYAYLCYLAGQIGLDFFEFNAVINIFIMIIIIYILKKYTKNYCFVMSLLFIYPFIENIIQKRFYLASIIVCLAIVSFLLKKGIIYKFIYIILIIIATYVHQSAIFYLLFLIYPIINKKKTFIIMLIISIVFSLFLPDLSSIFFAEKTELYFGELHSKIKYPILNFILWSGFHICFVFLYYIFYSKCKKHISNKIFYKYIISINKINICSLLFIPMYAWEPTFFRIFRGILLLNYIAISMIIPSGYKYYKIVFYSMIIYIIYIIISFVCIYFFASAGYKEMIEPIFINNILLESI